MRTQKLYDKPKILYEKRAGIRKQFKNIIRKMIGTNKKILILFVSLIAACAMPQSLRAQDDRLHENWQRDDRHGVCVDFRVNSSTIERDFHDNAAVLDRIDSLCNAVNGDSLVKVVSLEFYGSASPEGHADYNYRLSHARMKALEKLVYDRIKLDESVVIHNDHYIGWEHLKDLVTEDETMPFKYHVMEILDTEYPMAKDWKGRAINGRIPKLMALDNGRIWKELHNRHFIHMRNAWFILQLVRTPAPEPAPEPEPVVEPEPTPEPAKEPTETSTEEAAVEAEPRPLISIKNNLLEDAALIMNIGAEVRITDRLSFDVLGHYSPYDYFNDNRKIRVFAIEPEVRYWWGDPLVKGHFLGVHVPVIGFNVQLNDKFRYQDPNHATWGVGVSYGYAMPLGKSSNWGIEFTVGLGYMNIKYDVYEGVTNGRYLRTETRNYIGPTRLGVEISYRINVGKKDKKSKTLEE